MWKKGPDGVNYWTNEPPKAPKRPAPHPTPPKPRDGRWKKGPDGVNYWVEDSSHAPAVKPTPNVDDDDSRPPRDEKTGQFKAPPKKRS